jgi:hypothetical protein
MNIKLKGSGHSAGKTEVVYDSTKTTNRTKAIIAYDMVYFKVKADN